MRVRQLTGRNAGEIIDLPYAVATACVSAGTACWPDAEIPRVRGMARSEAVSLDIQGEVLTRPDDAEPGIQISGETADGEVLPPAIEKRRSSRSRKE